MTFDWAIATILVIAFGVLITAWAYLDFHRPYQPEDVRFSVPSRRYFASLVLHIALLVSIYGGLVVMATVGAARWFYDRPAEPATLACIAAASALFLRIAMPILPGGRDLLDTLRSVTHELALFPFARETLVAALARSRVAGEAHWNLELSDELERYGVDPKSLSFLSDSAKNSLQELRSIRERLTEVTDTTLPEPARGSRSAQPSHSVSKSPPGTLLRLRRFSLARKPAIEQLDRDYRGSFAAWRAR
jgi:hypothetical protein